MDPLPRLCLGPAARTRGRLLNHITAAKTDSRAWRGSFNPLTGPEPLTLLKTELIRRRLSHQLTAEPRGNIQKSATAGATWRLKHHVDDGVNRVSGLLRSESESPDFSGPSPSLRTSPLKEYKVVGRLLPSTKNPNPPLYRMRIFAPNHIVAKSRFWYFVSQLRKMKKASGEIVYCGLVHEKTPLKVKNFGIWLRYDSRSGTHNMYREYRDLTTSGAVTQCYRDMGARHRARAHSIQIMKVQVIAANKCRRPAIKQFHDSKIKFPLPHRVLRRQHKPRFTTKRPNTFF
ncbi:large ribosomal subunit protein eL20 [Xenentodon cancila]